MDSTVKLIFSIFAAATTLLTLYGAVKADRKLFLSGLCFFSILPVVGESMAYNADGASLHVIVALVFLTQFVLAFPNNIEYGADNIAAGKLTTKIALALLIFNIGGIIYVFCLKSMVPHRFGYCHIALSLAIIYAMVRRMTNNGVWLK
jgi:hypothetical protein